jgi:hypothetical protein
MVGGVCWNFTPSFAGPLSRRSHRTSFRVYRRPPLKSPLSWIFDLGQPSDRIHLDSSAGDDPAEFTGRRALVGRGDLSSGQEDRCSFGRGQRQA